MWYNQLFDDIQNSCFWIWEVFVEWILGGGQWWGWSKEKKWQKLENEKPLPPVAQHELWNDDE
jgi:hypothetical protein